MPDLLTREDQNTLVDLIDRCGLLSQPLDRQAILIEIGLDPTTIDFAEGTAHNFAVSIIYDLNRQDNREALRQVFKKARDRTRGMRQDLASLESTLEVLPRTPNGSSNPGPVGGDPAARGVQALTYISSGSLPIKEAAATFSAVFHSACEQIHDVAEYKNLHDQLHELQIKCYDILAASAARFPGDEDVKTDLEECRMTFEGVLGQLRDIAARFNRADTKWILQLEAALVDFTGALLQDCPALLKQAIRKMDRELSLRPPQINTRLNQAARALNLSELVNALSKVYDYAAKLKPDSTEMIEFKNGVASLARMDESLSALIRLHDRWQDVDTELRAMDKDSRNPEELGYWWPDFKPKALEISQLVKGDWAQSFKGYGEDLEAAIRNNDPAKTKRSFRLIRRSVSIPFYKTDADLKNQCDELLKVGEPLTTVLRVIS